MKNNNRRNFLKAGAVASGSLLLSPALGFAQTATDEKKKNTGSKQRTLGTGKQAHLKETLWRADYEFTQDELRTFTEKSLE